MANSFLTALESHGWHTENGAVSHATTGDAVLDYFAKSATYSARTPLEVAGSLSRAWADSPLLTLSTIFYNRMITRSPGGFVEIDNVQSGQGMRDEFRKALGWLHRAHPDVLYENLWLVPVVGVWKDLWHYDTVEVLDSKRVYELVARGIADDYNRPLVAKYLPRIRSKSNISQPRHVAFNRWARGLCDHLNWSERDYRKFKSDPENRAHVWQRQMSAGQWDRIDFDAIPGKALFKLINNSSRTDGKGALERHVASAVVEWAQSAESVKFTGFVHELVKVARDPQANFIQRTITDKQFDGLIDLATRDRGGLTENIWCALDTSGSMTARVANTSAFEICIGIGVYFSTLNQGAFKDHVIMFDSVSRAQKLGGSFTDKVQQIMATKTAWGSTNFESVIDEIVRVRKDNPDVPIEEYPTTLIVVSDMQFNPVEGSTETNYESAMRKLAQAGLPKMRIVWWWVTGRGTDFPSKFDDEGVIMIGGFDGSILSLLLGGEANEESTSPEQDSRVSATKVPLTVTPAEAMMVALDQEVLRQLRIPGGTEQIESVNSN